MERKYPAKMFIIGVIINFLFHNFYLFLLGVILCIVGMWSDICLYIGLSVLGLDLVLSIYDQIQIRKAALSESDNPEFNELMDAFYGPEGPDAFQKIMEEKMQSSLAFEFDEEQEKREQAERQALLQKLVVYRTLRDSIHDGMTLDEMIDAFAQMCKTSVGDPDDLLFETGTYDFTGEKIFYFSLVRQFQFMDKDEYVQLHLDVMYAPSTKTKLLRGAKWGSLTEGDFFDLVKNSRAYYTVKDMPIAKVEVRVEET